MRPWRRYQAAALGVIGLAGLLATWEVLARTGLIDPIVLASPARVLAALGRQWGSGELLADLAVSLGEFAAAFMTAAAVGVTLGLAMGLSRDAEAALEPFVWFLYAAPLVAFQPLLVVWLGFGFRTVVALAFLLAVIPIAVSTLAGVRSVDPVLRRAVRGFGGGPGAEVVKVVLPAAFPLVLAGLRLGVGRVLVGVVAGEMFSANAGLGFRMTYHGARLRTAEVLASLVLVVGVGVLMTQAIRLAEHRLDRWRGQAFTS